MLLVRNFLAYVSFFQDNAKGSWRQMTQNVTYLLLQLYYMNLSNSERSQSFDKSYAVTLSTSIIAAALSPTAAIGNALVLAAIWRNPSLRTSSYILIAGLAFTDFFTGLITQPFYVANKLNSLEDSPLNPIDNVRDLNVGIEGYHE